MRRAVVAGAFYKGEKGELEAQLKECFSGVTGEGGANVLGAVVPHAGYMYSGGVAASVYATLPAADTFVILGPNHWDLGSLVAVSTDTWSTPLGEVEVDRAFVDALPKRIIDLDETAHMREHSIEVQLPFLQFLFDKNFQIVPISMMHPLDLQTAKEVGEELTTALSELEAREEKKSVVVLASSDFTHYEPERIAREKDNYVIEAIAELDVAKFYSRRYERNVSACGVGPIVAAMHAAKKRGAKAGKLIRYATSGEVTGDRAEVVGYGGIIFVR